MKIGILSDVHCECDRDRGENFVKSLDPRGVDVLVLAGDIGSGAELGAMVGRFAERYPAVVYVHGNHEFYFSDRETVLGRTAEITARHPHVRFLDGSMATIGGVRFLGTPLWFPPAPPGLRGRERSYMTDFSVIADYEQWVYAEHERGRRFLEEHARPGDVVVTHHLPAPESVAPEYYGDPGNAFFLADVRPIIREAEPALWVHGHTHVPCRYQFGRTEVICNPRGYPAERGNRKRRFVRNLTVEIPRPAGPLTSG